MTVVQWSTKPDTGNKYVRSGITSQIRSGSTVAFSSSFIFLCVHKDFRDMIPANHVADVSTINNRPQTRTRDGGADGAKDVVLSRQRQVGAAPEEAQRRP